MEIWKDIKEYDGYQASSCGRIRTHNKVTYTKKHGERRWKERILKQKLSVSDNCYRVELWKDGMHKTYLVHRLVAATFFNVSLDTKLTVNHKDGNRRNNNIDNLEFLSMKDNIVHAFNNNYCHQYNCVLLDDMGNERYFRSISQASLYIGRSIGYISACLKHNRPIKDRDGKIYTAKIYINTKDSRQPLPVLARNQT